MATALGGQARATAPDEPDSSSLTVTSEEAALMESLRDASIGERVRAHSESWLGLPYLDGGFGEGGGVDPDPMIRRDAFDCLTLVEEVLALSLATDPAGVHAIRMGLRYRNGGPATYENRRHFMLAEWIPGTIEEGWMEEITSNYEGAERMHWEVSSDTWAGWSKRHLFPLADTRLPVGAEEFWYLPIDAALAAVNDIPPGTVVFTLRQPFAHLPIAITHVGIVVDTGQPTLRHATKIGDDMVKDHPLEWYIDHLRTYVNWPAAGVILLAPREIGPRRLRFE